MNRTDEYTVTVEREIEGTVAAEITVEACSEAHAVAIAGRLIEMPEDLDGVVCCPGWDVTYADMADPKFSAELA